MAARHDLYNGLIEVLGTERTETLMAALPTRDASELVTKSDLARFEAELHADLRADMHEMAAAINLRIDRLFLAWVGGLVVIVGALAGVVLIR